MHILLGGGDSRRQVFLFTICSVAKHLFQNFIHHPVTENVAFMPRRANLFLRRGFSFQTMQSIKDTKEGVAIGAFL